MIKQVKDIRYTLEYQSRDVCTIKRRLSEIENKVKEIERLIGSTESSLTAASNFIEESPTDAKRQIKEAEYTINKIKECIK